MLKVGLTGGIASGKSAVADQLANLGVTVIDTDELAREVVRPNSTGLQAVVTAFGSDILQPDGQLNRTMLREQVFADAALRQRLETILHPRIQVLTSERIAAAQGTYVIAVVPLLVETDFADLIDRVLVVDCKTELQLERVMQRDSISRAAAERIIGAQTSRAQRLAKADDVISNNGDRRDLEAAVAAVHHQYLSISDA